MLIQKIQGQTLVMESELVLDEMVCCGSVQEIV